MVLSIVRSFIMPKRRLPVCTPEDLMGPSCVPCSNASNFVNGHVLYVDGGILAYIGKQPK